MSADSELAEFKQPTIEEIMALVVGWSVEEKAKLLARIIGNNLGLTVVCGDSDNAAKSMAFQVSMMPVSDYPDVLRAIAKQIESHSLEQKRRQLAEAIASHLEYGLNDDLSLFLQRSASLVYKASNPKQIRIIAAQICAQITVSPEAIGRLVNSPETLEFYMQFKKPTSLQVLTATEDLLAVVSRIT